MTENQSTVENAKEKLDRWLKDGLTTPGGKLPSEREMCELLGDQTYDPAPGIVEP
jgi:transcriptional regulator, GntR family